MSWFYYLVKKKVVEESKEDVAKLLEKENVKSTKRSSLSTPRKMSLKSLTISYRVCSLFVSICTDCNDVLVSFYAFRLNHAMRPVTILQSLQLLCLR